MSKKKGFSFMKIVLCFALGAMLFTFQSCKKDRSSTDQPSSLGISAASNFPAWSSDGARIIFNSRSDDQNNEIYMMNADGTGLTRLTDNPANDRWPSWSPDGTRIAFNSNRDGNSEIYIMNTDGSNQTKLTDNPADEYAPTWSPDGTRIAFHSNRDGNWEIYVMNTGGSNQTRLTDNPAEDRLPCWSPDGSRIAFASVRDGNEEVYIMNADGSNQTRLTDNSSRDRWPSWSPDGTRIAFHSNRDGNSEIYIMNTDGSNQTRLTDNPADEYAPTWSPDGQKIAFVSNRDFIEEVYVMDADGSDPVNLTNNAPFNATYGLAPVPRSEMDLEDIPYKIVFDSLRETDGKENGEICLIDADGSNFVNLTNTPEIDEMIPNTSPNGRMICFEAVEGEDLESKSRDVYIMNIDGTERVKIAGNAFFPCWSADGRYIAYLPGEYPRYNPAYWANKGLEIYDLETNEVRRHPNDEITHNGHLTWSPDGKWFVVSSRGPNVAFKAYDNTKMVLATIGCTPDISPDGKRIAWNSSDFHLNIGTLDFDSPQANVTDHRVVVACEREYSVYGADWSPDGNYLTFSYWPNDGDFPHPGSNICICDLRTGKWTQITTDGKLYTEPNWIPLQVR